MGDHPTEILPNAVYDTESLRVVFGTRARVDRFLRIGKPIPFRKGQWRGFRILEALERMEADWLGGAKTKKKPSNSAVQNSIKTKGQKKPERVVVRRDAQEDK